jgi:peptide/nickel transport system substrate-binding protein
MSLSRRGVLQLGGGLGLVGGLNLMPGASFAQGDDTLTIAIPSDLGGWDHDYLAFDLVGLAMMKNTYPFMLDYGVQEVAGGRIHDTETVVPTFAESWESNEDGTVWTMRIRQGVSFPSGNELTAEDVKWSKDRAFAAQANVAGIYRIIGLTEPDQVEVVDRYTVRFHQARPSAMTSQIQIISLYVFDSQLVQEHATADDPWATEWVNQTPQLGGAYNVVDYIPGEEIVLEANPEFPLGEPPINRVRLLVIPAPANRRLLLQNGDVDIALGLPRRDIFDLSGASGVSVISAPSNEFVFIPMSTVTAPFDDPMVRRAMAHAVPYQQIIDSVYNGDARRSTSPVPLDMPGHSDSGYPYDYDPERARELLAEAGYPDGFETSIVIVTDNVEQERVAILLQAAMADVGVTLNIESVDPATLQQRRQERSIPMQVASGQMWVNDIEYLLSVALTEGGFLNYANYDNPRVNAIFSELNGLLDEDARQSLFAEVQEILAEDCPWLVICQPNFGLPVAGNISGWVQPVDGLFRLRYLET